MSRDLTTLGAADFAPLVGTPWRVVGAGPNAASGPVADLSQPLALELVEVTTAGGGTPGRKSFSLVFRGAQGRPLPQRIYHLEHDTLGSLEIFLVPIRPDARGPLFQAVFN
jgi:hypothetical protein